MILDMTCGGRMMWHDKTHPDTVYMDRRIFHTGTLKYQPGFSVIPDIQADYSQMPFKDGVFNLVVFDPPHAEIPDGSIIATKYGRLFGDSLTSVADGLWEGWRVLAAGGTLVFKWAETSYSLKEVLDLFSVPPAFGHVTAKSGKTKWVSFHKG